MSVLKYSFLAFFLAASSAGAQTKYWIFLSDKNPASAPAVSAQTLQNRQVQGLPRNDDTDLPIRAEYLLALQAQGVQPVHASKWLNAVSAQLTDHQVNKLKANHFVKSVQRMNSDFYVAKIPNALPPQLGTALKYDPVLLQVQAEAFAEAGLTGKGVTVGVIDAGYLGAKRAEPLKHLFADGLFTSPKVRGKRDYVSSNRDNDFYENMVAFTDFHGTEVLTAITGADNEQKIQSGLATDAAFYLARTDHGDREWRGEEDNWVAAMEWMDSLGVRVINTSLGYAKGFTDPKENYEPVEMDGKTSVISRAAQIAVDKKGILLIVSAGNEGEDQTWRVVSTPADAQGVLSIGATNEKLWNRIGYSSIGPESLGYLKPNVACFSLMGTSLSAPVITGFAACLMQANPALGNKELMSIIEKSAHLYPYGNNYVGYGVPQASRALALLNQQNTQPTAREITAKGRNVVIKIATEKNDIVSVFRKRSATHVIVQEALRVKNGTVSIRRYANETHTTIDLKTEVIEVKWQ